MDKRYEAKFYQAIKDLESVLCGGMASGKTMKSFADLLLCIGEEIESPLLKLQIEKEVDDWQNTLSALEHNAKESGNEKLRGRKH